MESHDIVSSEAWITARKGLLEKEKALTRLRDEVSAARRGLPWRRIEKTYTFDGPDGKETLADLFAGRSQLIVYHFMYGPDWDDGCKSCSFIADHYDPAIVHLAARDVTMVTISRAPLATLQAFQKRMGWRFKWLSSHGSDFNRDFGVTFTEQEIESGTASYNYGLSSFSSTEAPGISVLCQDGDDVYHTYSSFSRGLDMFIGAYHLLDIVPKGRDEEGLPNTMAWLRHHDRYPHSGG